MRYRLYSVAYYHLHSAPFASVIFVAPVSSLPTHPTSCNAAPSYFQLLHAHGAQRRSAPRFVHLNTMGFGCSHVRWTAEVMVRCVLSACLVCFFPAPRVSGCRAGLAIRTRTLLLTYQRSCTRRVHAQAARRCDGCVRV